MNLGTLGMAWAVAASLSAPVAAADFSDPTWPCIQRKVEALSIGLMWPDPIAEVKLGPEQAAAVKELAETLALRRVDLEAAKATVAGFVAAQGADTVLLGQVYQRVFHSLTNRRTRIVEGIERFSLGQADLAARIDAARVEMDALMAADDPDFDKVDALEQQLDWDQTIYSDRQQSITYLCETPTLLEKRLYAIAQMLQAAGQGG